MRVKFICENCGYRTILNTTDYKCPVCEFELTKLGFLDGHKLVNLNNEQKIQWLEKKIGHPLSEEMLALRNQWHENKRIEHEKQREEERQRRMLKSIEYGKQLMEERSRVPKCPICGSTNLKKITITTRAVKMAAFGTIGAIDDAGKTYKCENCGSKF